MVINTETLELVIFKHCLEDEVYLSSVIDVLDYRFFDNQNIQPFIRIIKKFYTEYGKKPTKQQLKLCLKTKELQASYTKLEPILKHTDFIDDDLFLLKETENYFKQKAVYQTLLDTANNLKNNSDPQKILHSFEKACNISLDIDLGLNYFKDLDALHSLLSDNEERIKTGYSWLDEKLGGGFLKNGRALYIIAGGVNTGKSIVVGNLASRVLIQDSGKKVLIISLEMSEAVYAKRISSNLTQININKIHEQDNKEQFITDLSQLRDKYPDARLHLKEFPPNTITPTYLKSYISQVSRKLFKPDIIFIDYINLLSLPGSGMYERLKDISEQTRALSYIFECPVISPTQLNKEGFTSDTPGLENVAESMGIPATADVLIVVWRTDDDVDDDTIHMGFSKNRFGLNFGKQRFAMKFETLTIEEEDMLNEESTLIDTENSLLSIGGMTI